jgi:hypothetical protein
MSDYLFHNEGNRQKMPISFSLVLQLVYPSFESFYFFLEALAPRSPPMVDKSLQLGFGHRSFALFISGEHLGQVHG